jgi:hypothetical protein
MEPAAARLKTLHDAQTLRCLIEQERDDSADGVDLLLLTLLDISILDQSYQLGLTDCPYNDDLQRRIFLKQILQTADKILDKLAEHANGEDLASAAVGLCKLLFESTFSAFLSIKAIEAEYPRLAAEFEQERNEYALSR